MSASLHSASASNTHVSLNNVRDISQDTFVPWNPLGRLDYVYGCLDSLLRDNGFKGKFFKEPTGKGSLAKLLYTLYLRSHIGIVGLVILMIVAINFPDIEQYAIIFRICLACCMAYIELWLLRGIIVYFQNYKLANAVFGLLTKRTESLRDLNQFLEVTLTATEIGVKMDAIRAALRTESADIEVTAGRIQAGVLNRQSLKIQIMLYKKAWIEKHYYRIFYCFVVFSVFFFVVLYFMFVN
jgi:hypothetical protein